MMNNKYSKFMGVLLTLVMLGSAFSALAQIAGATGSRAAEIESNNDPGHATPITSGSVMTGSLMVTAADDYQDFYSFSCNKGQAINASLYHIEYDNADTGKYNLNVILWGPADDTGVNYKALWVSFLQTRWETASGLCAYAGTYFFEVRINVSGSNPGTLATHYTLDVTVYDPTPLLGGQSDNKVLTMDGPKWMHWYKITAPKDQIFTVKTTPPAQGQVDMDMYAIWNRGFDKTAGNQTLQPWFLNTSRTSGVGVAGQMNAMNGDLEIYVQTWLRKGTGLGATKFEVINTQIPSDNNNVPADATEIKKTSSFLAHIQQSVDTMDWYKFTIDSGFHANITFSPQNTKTSYWNMTIWDSNQDYVMGYFNTKNYNPFIPSTTGPPADPGNPVMGSITLTNWQPASAGTYYISITGLVADPQNNFGAPPLVDQDYRLYVELPNFGPEVKTTIPDAEINEDEKYSGLDVSDYFKDKEGDTLTYAARVDDKTHITLKLTGSNLTATPTPNWNGECNITVDATDGMANLGASTIHQTFKLTVVAVNDLPYLTETPFVNFTMTEGEKDRQTFPFKLSEVFKDIDSPLSYTWSGNQKIQIKMDAKTTNVYFTAPDLWFGEENVTFTAKDEGTAPAKDPVNIKVIHKNHEPSFTGTDGLYEIEMKENDPADTTLNAADMFMDIDTTYAGDHLIYRLRDPLPLHLNITILDDFTISVVPEEYWSGDAEFRVYAQDSLGAENETKVTVKVEHVNQPPHINAFTPVKTELVIKEGQNQAFTITSVSDRDNDTKYDIRYYWYVNNDIQSGANVQNHQFTFRTVFLEENGFAAGDYHIKCVVTDGLLQVQNEWNISVTDVNQAPTGAKINAPLANVLYVEGKPITFTADQGASDLDNDPVTFRWSIDATNTTLSTERDFTLDWKDKAISKELKPGQHKIDLTISDGRGGTQTTSMMLSIKAKPKKGTPGFEMPLLLVAMLVAVVALGNRKFKHN
jgi:hypothetical protein